MYICTNYYIVNENLTYNLRPYSKNFLNNFQKKNAPNKQNTVKTDYLYCTKETVLK